MIIPDVAPGTHTVVLVEGVSDRSAILRLAGRAGVSLGGLSVEVVAMGGATNVGHCVRRFGGRELHLVGLCDVGEIGYFERAFADLHDTALFVCDRDLEDELIRAIGHDEMVRFIERQGEGSTFEIFRKQPAQRDRSLGEHLHRFVGIRSGRKERYGGDMIDALDLARTPEPLRQLLDRLAG